MITGKMLGEPCKFWRYETIHKLRKLVYFQLQVFVQVVEGFLLFQNTLCVVRRDGVCPSAISVVSTASIQIRQTVQALWNGIVSVRCLFPQGSCWVSKELMNMRASVGFNPISVKSCWQQ